MTIFIDTARNLVIYLIVTTIIKNLTGGSAYIKYAEFLMGIILILILVNPIASLLQMEGNLEQYMKVNRIFYDMKGEVNELHVEEGAVEEAVLERAASQFEEQIQELADREGVPSEDCIVTLSAAEKSFGSIERVEVWTGKKNGGISVDKIRIGTSKENKSASYPDLVRQICDIYGVLEEAVFLY